MVEFNRKNYGRVAIHVPTQELYNRIAKVFADSGHTLASGKSYFEQDVWSSYKEKTTLYLDAGTFAYYEFTKDERYAIITAEEFLNKHEQTMEYKHFIITGERHHLEAFMKDLTGVGYKDCYNETIGTDIVIGPNWNICSHKELDKFKQVGLFCNNILLRHEKVVKFKLPEQWKEALEYAKNALTWSIWNEKKEIKLVLGSKNDEIVISKSSVTVGGEDYPTQQLMDIIQTLGNSMELGAYTVNLSADRDMRHIRIGCQSSNHLFSLNELIQIQTEYNNLQK